MSIQYRPNYVPHISLTPHFRVSCEEGSVFLLQLSERFERIPELRLWCEVIFRASFDVQTYLFHRKYHMWNDAINAKKWILKEDISLYSFLWACEVTFPECCEALSQRIRKQTPESLPPPLVQRYIREKHTKSQKFSYAP